MAGIKVKHAVLYTACLATTGIDSSRINGIVMLFGGAPYLFDGFVDSSFPVLVVVFFPRIDFSYANKVLSFGLD